jgi:hypothetical protein
MVDWTGNFATPRARVHVCVRLTVERTKDITVTARMVGLRRCFPWKCEGVKARQRGEWAAVSGTVCDRGSAMNSQSAWGFLSAAKTRGFRAVGKLLQV